MAKKLHYLTDDEVQLIQEVVTQTLGSQTNRPGPPTGELDSAQSPETYIVHTDGVAAIDGDKPGRGTCQIYNLQTDTLLGMDLHRPLWNLSDEVLGAGYVLAIRDKFRNWVAVKPGSGGRLMILLTCMHEHPDGQARTGYSGHYEFVTVRLNPDTAEFEIVTDGPSGDGLLTYARDVNHARIRCDGSLGPGCPRGRITFVEQTITLTSGDKVYLVDLGVSDTDPDCAQQFAPAVFQYCDTSSSSSSST